MFPWLSALASNVSSPILLSETTPEPSDFELAWSMLTTIFSWVVIGDFAFCGCFLFGAMFFKFMCFTKYPTDLSGIKPAEPTADTSLKGAELRPQRMELAKAHPKGLWRLDDQFYDLTEFVRHHPGGELAISQSEGTEISALFHSHHMRAIPESLLAKYRVQVEPATAARIPPCDYSFHEKGFFQTCKRRCNAYLKENNLKSGSEASTNYVVGKIGGCMAVFALTWYGVCTLPLGPFAIALALVNCWSRACLTGIGHEAIHGRAKNALTFDFFDMIMLFPSDKWHDEHVIQHHPHTKRFDHDPDEVLDPFRLCQDIAWEPHHLLQGPLQLIMIFASVISWIDKHLSVPHMLINKGKANFDIPLRGCVYLLLFHALPFLVRSEGAAILTLLSAGAGSLLIVLAFHLSHINEPNTEEAVKFKEGDDWGAFQMSVSANFVGRPWALFGITGMLEMQIEHHMFPSLSYRNQQRIKPIIEKTAKEFGLSYWEYPNAIAGVQGHMYSIHKFSSKPDMPFDGNSAATLELHGKKVQ